MRFLVVALLVAIPLVITSSLCAAEVESCGASNEELTLLRDQRLTTRGGLSSIDCASDGSTLVVCDSKSNALLLDANDLTEKKKLKSLAQWAAFGQDSKRILLQQFHREQFRVASDIKVVNIETEAVELTLPATKTTHFDASRNLFVYPGGPDEICDTVFVYDLAKKKVVAEALIDGSDVVAVHSPSRSGVIGINPYNITTQYVWFPPYDKAPTVLEVGKPSRHMHVSHDGRTAALGTYENTIEIWDIVKKMRLREIPLGEGNGGEARGLLFSPDGDYLVALADRGEIVVWETTDFREIARVKGHTGLSVSLAFFPDGRRFATGGPDGVKVWQIEGREKGDK